MNPEIEVEAPARRAFPYGLFSAASERDEERRWTNGVEWLGVGCDSPFVTTSDGCEEPVEFERGTGGVSGEALPINVYAPFECSPVSWTDTSASARAVEKLTAGEEQAVERALMTGSAGNMPNLMGDAQVVAGGETAGSATATLATLEQWIVDNYGGLGVLHVSRGAATVLAGSQLIAASGARMLTKLGTPVSVGAGYPNTAPDGADAGAGEFWAYMSPSVFMYRGETSTEAAFDRAQNNLLATAFRTFVVGYDDCGVGAARFTVE